MQIEKTVAGVKAQVKAWKKEGLSVGLVPVSYTHLDVYKRQHENGEGSGCTAEFS